MLVRAVLLQASMPNLERNLHSFRSVAAEAWLCIEVNPERAEFLLCFDHCGIYVSSNEAGRKSRPTGDLLWPARPLGMAYSRPHLLLFSEAGCFVYDVATAEWLQTLTSRRARPLNREGSLTASSTVGSARLAFVRDLAQEPKLKLPSSTSRRQFKPRKKFSFKSKEVKSTLFLLTQ